MTVAINVKHDCGNLIENSHTVSWKQKHHMIQIIDKLQTLLFLCDTHQHG